MKQTTQIPNIRVNYKNNLNRGSDTGLVDNLSNPYPQKAGLVPDSPELAGPLPAPRSTPGPTGDSRCEVPAELACSLCGRVRKMMSRLVCDGTEVCWNCAVLKLNSTHKCWKCNKAPVYTSDHLAKDQVLDMYVLQFLSTGRLDPVHLQALKNSKQAQVLVEGRSGSHGSMEGETDIHPKCEDADVVALLEVDESCIACWSEDMVWYNGRVMEVQERGAQVLFTDYGNEEFVDWTQV
jgi:hypothetical protein